MRKVWGKVAAGVVVAGLVLAGVGGAGASVRRDDGGVTKDDIKLGIAYVDLEPIRARGIKIDHGDYAKAYKAVVDDLNAKGGINGRTVVPVILGVNPSGTDPAQQACVQLAEDEKVFAVIGQFIGDAPLCYVEQHAMPIVGGTITAEALGRAKAPWYSLDAGSAATAQVVDAFVAEGLFKKAKLGIVTNANQKATLDEVVLPALERHKVKGTSAVIDAPAGDDAAARQQAATIVERFEADKVDTILLVGDSVIAVGDALAATDYRPRLLATSQNTAAAYATKAGTNLDVMKDAVTGNVGFDFSDPALQKCHALVQKATGQGPIIETPAAGEPSYRTSADNACRYVALFAALAEASGKQLTTASFGKAGKKAGTIELPGGPVTFDARTKEIAQPVYLYRFDPTTKVLVKDPEAVGVASASAK